MSIITISFVAIFFGIQYVYAQNVMGRGPVVTITLDPLEQVKSDMVLRNYVDHHLLIHSTNINDTVYPLGPDFGLPSPLKQVKSGIKPSDTTCQVGLQPIIKSEDNSPACVKPNTASKLVERGWILISMSARQNIPVLSNSLKISNVNSTIDYNITGNGKILDIKQDTQSKALILLFETTSNGTLTVSVPRAFLDMTKSVRGEGSFGVLTDGRESNFTQIRITATDRIFSIPFTIGTHEIEIFVTQII